MLKASVARRQAALVIFSALREMHQRNRVVELAYGVELGIAESAVLQEVIASPDGIIAAELSKRLGLTAVKISRLIKAMIGQKLIQRALHGSHLAIVATSRGREIFESAYQRAQATFAAAYERVPQDQQSRFAEAMRQLCEGLRAPPASSLPFDPPLMAEVRRITRALGLLSRDAFGSGRSPLEWHVLSLVGGAKSQTSCAALASLLGTSHATMTTVLKRMQEDRLITKQAAIKDARERKLILTESGEAELSRVNQIGIQLLEGGLGVFSAFEAFQFAENCRAYSGEQIEQSGIVLSHPYVLVRLHDDRLPEARAFALRQRAEQNMMSEIPGSLFSAEHQNFALLKGSELSAVFEFAVAKRGKVVTLVQALGAKHEPPPDIMREALPRILEIIRTEEQLDQVPHLDSDKRQVSAHLTVSML